MTELHVIPDELTTTWRVYDADAPAPLSEHPSVMDAELAAHAASERRGGARVILHDRYHRTHGPTLSLAEARSLARSARARQLKVVRERIHRFPGG